MTQDLTKKHGRFAEAARLLDNNNVTDAMVYITKRFGLDSYIAVFEAIKTIHEQDGEMHQDLLDVRRRWVKLLKQWVRTNGTDRDIAHLTGLL